MMEKSAQPSGGGGCTPALFFTLFTIRYKVVVYAPAERADTLYPFSTLPLYVLCGRIKSVDLMKDCRALSTYNSVEEQIDETDIRKIPQIVWAESGSLTVPV